MATFDTSTLPDFGNIGSSPLTQNISEAPVRNEYINFVNDGNSSGMIISGGNRILVERVGNTVTLENTGPGSSEGTGGGNAVKADIGKFELPFALKSIPKTGDAFIFTDGKATIRTIDATFTVDEPRDSKGASLTSRNGATSPDADEKAQIENSEGKRYFATGDTSSTAMKAMSAIYAMNSFSAPSVTITSENFQKVYGDGTSSFSKALFNMLNKRSGGKLAKDMAQAAKARAASEKALTIEDIAKRNIASTQDAVNSQLNAKKKSGGNTVVGTGMSGANNKLPVPGASPFDDPTSPHTPGATPQSSNAGAMLAGITKTDIILADGTVIKGGIGFGTRGSIVEVKVGKEIVENAAVVVKAGLGKEHKEYLMSLGFKIAENNYLVLTHQELSERLSFQFDTQTQESWFKQVTNAAVWTWVNPDTESRLTYTKATAYKTSGASQSFGVEQILETNGSIQTLWEKEMRTAGATIIGAKGAVGVKITDKLNLQLGVGYEERTDDFLAGAKKKTSPTGQVGLQYKLTDTLNASAGVSGSATGKQYTGGLTGKWGDLNVGIQGYKSETKDAKGSYGVMFNVAGNVNLDGMPVPKSAAVSRTRSEKITQEEAKNAEIAAKNVSVPEYYKPGNTDDTYTVSALDMAAANGGVIPEAKVPEIHDKRVEQKNDPASAIQLPFAAPKSVLDATFQAGEESHIPKNIITQQKDTTVEKVRISSIDQSAVPGATLDPKTGNVIIPTALDLGMAESAKIVGGIDLPISAFVITGKTLVLNSKMLAPLLQPGISTIELTTSAAIVTLTVRQGSLEVLNMKIEARIVGPAAVKATQDDNGNKIVPAPGVDTSGWEVAILAAGSTAVPQYEKYVPDTKYPGNKKVLIRNTPKGVVTTFNFTNSAPKFTEGSNITATFTGGVANTIAAPKKIEDADNDTLSFSLTALEGGKVPAGVTIDRATGSITVSALVAAGEYVFNRTVTDGEFPVNQEIKLTMKAPTTLPPAAHVDDDKNTIIPDDTKADTSNWVYSIDNGTTYSVFTLTTVFLSDKTVLLKKKAIAATATTPAIPESAPITLKFTNSAPKITGGNITASYTVGSSGSIPAMAVTDADNDTIVQSLSGAPTGVTISATGVITIASTLAVGTYTFTRIASDGKLTASQKVQVTINAIIPPSNNAPTITKTADFSANNGTTVNGRTFTVSDADGQAQSVALSGTGTFTVTAIPGATINNNGTANVTITGVPAGTVVTYSYAAPATGNSDTITQTTNDGNGGAKTVTTAVTLSALPPSNNAPTITKTADFSANNGTTVNGRTFTVSDTDGQAQSVTLSGTGIFTVTAIPGATITNNGTANVTITGVPAGTVVTYSYAAPATGNSDTITQTTNDGNGGAKTVTTAVTLSALPPSNNAPTITKTADFSANNGTTVNGRTFTVSDTDGQAQSVTLSGTGIFTVTAIPGATITNNGTANVTITGVPAGTVVTYSYAAPATGNSDTITQTTNDGNGGAKTVTTAVTLSALPPSNNAPTITKTADFSANNGTTVNGRTFTVSDADGQAQSVALSGTGTFTVTAIPGATINNNGTANVTITGVPAGTVVTYSYAAPATGNSDTITQTTNDGVGGTRTVTTTATLSVLPPSNNAPAIVKTVDFSVNRSATVAGKTFTVNDADGQAQSVTLSGTGTFTIAAIAGATINNNGTSTVTITGVPAGTVVTYSYVAPAAGNSDTIIQSTNDGNGGTDSVTTVVTLTVAAPATAPTSFALINDAGSSGSDNYTNDTRAAWAALAGITSYMVSLNGISWVDIGNTTNYNFNTLSPVQGSNDFYVRGNNAGGPGPSSKITINYSLIAISTPTYIANIPDTQGATVNNVTIGASKSFEGATFTSVTSEGGGTISGYTVNGSGYLVITSYTGPATDTDFIKIVGFDKWGVPFTLSRRVELTPVADITPPSTPTLTSTPQYTNQNTVSVEVNGEVGATVWINGALSAYTVGAGGKVSVSLDTSGADGAKNFAITLKDSSPNHNVSGALNVSIDKNTTPPDGVTFVSPPDTGGTTYNNLIISGKDGRNFLGATLTVTSQEGGTISGVTIDGSGQIVISQYNTPSTATDNLIITGTDRYGNTINISRIVSLG